MNPVQKIENTQLNTDNKENILSINVRIDGFSFIILNNNTITTAEAYEWQNKDWAFASTKMEEILKTKPVFNDSFKRVLCFIQNSDTSLIPNEYIIDPEKRRALELYLGKSDFDVLSVGLKEIPANLIFGIDSKVRSLIKSKFSNIDIFHKSAFFIDSSLANSVENQVINLKILRQEFEVIGIMDKKLISHNFFKFQTVDEFMFLLLSFIQKNNFDTEKLNLKISGKLLRDSKIGLKLDKYFRNIEIEKVSDDKEAAFQTLKKYTIVANN